MRIPPLPTVIVAVVFIPVMIALNAGDPPLTEAQLPSPRQNVDEDAPVPLFRFVTGRLPVTSPLPRLTADEVTVCVLPAKWPIPTPGEEATTQVGQLSVFVERLSGRLKVAVKSLIAGCVHAPFQNFWLGAVPTVTVTAPVDPELVIKTPSPVKDDTPLAPVADNVVPVNNNPLPIVKIEGAPVVVVLNRSRLPARTAQRR